MIDVVILFFLFLSFILIFINVKKNQNQLLSLLVAFQVCVAVYKIYKIVDFWIRYHAIGSIDLSEAIAVTVLELATILITIDTVFTGIAL